jgi:hypothetical protein
MYTGARRSLHPARVNHAAPAKGAASAAPRPVEHTGDAAPSSAVAPGPAERVAALGGILARAVTQRAGDGSVTLQSLPRGSRLLQRMATQASHLDKHISMSETVKGAFGKSNEATKAFAAIRDALSAYQSAARKGKSDLATQARQLEVIDDLCARFLQQHGKDKRRAIVDRLSDEVNMERKTVSQLQAEQIYQGNVASGRKPIDATETDPAKKFGFQALTSPGKSGATDHSMAIDPGVTGPRRAERIKIAEHKYGLTDAEVSAITIFSAGDFSYINPVTVNSPSWLAKEKAKTTENWGKVDDRTLREEGSLHTAVAVRGLLKMEPYKGETYRGARFKPEDVNFVPGKIISYGSLTSSTKDKDVAANFVYGLESGSNIEPEKTAAVLYIITDSGGRDISEIALVRKEAEVLLLPGSVFEVTSVEELEADAQNAKYADKVQQAVKKKQPLPTSWYVVRLVRSDKPAPIAPPPPPTVKWKRAAPGPAADPYAIPQDVGILGQDRKSSGRARRQ